MITTTTEKIMIKDLIIPWELADDQNEDGTVGFEHTEEFEMFVSRASKNKELVKLLNKKLEKIEKDPKAPRDVRFRYKIILIGKSGDSSTPKTTEQCRSTISLSHEEAFYIEEYVKEFNREKKRMSNSFGGEDVYLLSGGLIQDLAAGKAININGKRIAINEKSDRMLIEGIEKKWNKEYGLDGEEEEK